MLDAPSATRPGARAASGRCRSWRGHTETSATTHCTQETLQSLGPIAGTEYHHLTGPILVRVTGELPPSVTTEYEAAVAGPS
ncbi:hypothetical protein SAMN04488546_0078 [Geodermatophilus poikilotrophus]|uniref:Uncharacterized protein n=1 Tax=Geodermatophilus poikilotrophus TaxID=1333667 RepID=A0A1H9YGJ5_9ACTN|nr:hypothetical protein SAMN04488546_0078 [Geodermatophilus poikilotrophus]